ncbi:MAG: hypothetical protein AAGE52_12635 [Myxococcota bacterium]
MGVWIATAVLISLPVLGGVWVVATGRRQQRLRQAALDRFVGELGGDRTSGEHSTAEWVMPDGAKGQLSVDERSTVLRLRTAAVQVRAAIANEGSVDLACFSIPAPRADMLDSGLIRRWSASTHKVFAESEAVAALLMTDEVLSAVGALSGIGLIPVEVVASPGVVRVRTGYVPERVEGFQDLLTAARAVQRALGHESAR